MWSQTVVWSVVALAAWWARGQVAGAACPDIPLQKNFSTDNYLGVWYEIQAEPSIFQSIKSCLASSFTRAAPDTVAVVSQGLDSSGAPTENKSTLKIVDEKNPAHMVTDFVPGVQPPYDIVETDYTTYSCIHSCLSVVGIKTEFVFIYARNRTLSKKLVDHCRSVFQSHGISTSSLEDTPQKECHLHSDL